MKRILSVFLALLFLLTALPLGAVNVDAATSGTIGDCVWYLENGHLSISGNGEIAGFLDPVDCPWGWDVSSITIDEGVTSIGNFVFYGHHLLTEIVIPASVKHIGERVFQYCDNLISIEVAEGNLDFCSEDGVLFNTDKSLLVQCPSGKEGEYTIPNNTTAVGDYAFSDCDNLTSLTIPESVTTIGKSAFYSCGLLRSVTVDINNLKYCSVDGVLFDKEMTILMLCPAQKSGNYIVPNSVKVIADNAFYFCSSLLSVAIPDSVTTIGRSAFMGCSSMESMVIPNSVTIIGDEAFRKCYSLISITLPNDITVIDFGLFLECDMLTMITIPDSVTTIGDYAFDGTNLTSVTIPNKVTTIGFHAFQYCVNLTSVTIPASVTTIGGAAFGDCERLSDIHYNGSQQDREHIEIGQYNESVLNAVWHYYTHIYDSDCNTCGAIREVPDILYGDANSDGHATLSDIGLLQQYLNGWSVTILDVACDANGDGKLNNKDLIQLIRYFNGWDVTLGG